MLNFFWVCEDSQNWKSPTGNTCADYVKNSWCENGQVGSGWNPSWGDLSLTGYSSHCRASAGSTLASGRTGRWHRLGLLFLDIGLQHLAYTDLACLCDSSRPSARPEHWDRSCFQGCRHWWMGFPSSLRTWFEDSEHHSRRWMGSWGSFPRFAADLYMVIFRLITIRQSFCFDYLLYWCQHQSYHGLRS